MKGMALIIILLQCFLGCSEKRNVNQPQIRMVTYLNCDTINFKDNTNKVAKDSFDMVFQGNISVYKISKTVFKNSIERIKSDTIDVGFINPVETYDYFVIEKDSRWGLKYNESSTLQGRFQTDSLLKELGIHKTMLGAYNLNLYKPASTEHKKDILIEKYLHKKLEKDDADSIYRYFDKGLTAIDFSFSPELDLKKRSKLVKTSFINVYPLENRKVGVIREEFYAEIKEKKIASAAEFVKIFNQFRKDRESIKLN